MSYLVLSLTHDFLILLTSPSVIFFQREKSWLLVNSLHQSSSISLIILAARNWALSSTIVLGRRRGLHIAFKPRMQAGFTRYHHNLFWFTLYSSSSNSQQLLVWLQLNADILLRPHSWTVMASLASITLYAKLRLSPSMHRFQVATLTNANIGNSVTWVMWLFAVVPHPYYPKNLLSASFLPNCLPGIFQLDSHSNLRCLEVTFSTDTATHLLLPYVLYLLGN